MGQPVSTTGRVRALCCVCGQLRTVSANASPRRDDPNVTYEGWGPYAHLLGWWRFTRTLKCATCKQQTRHALLRDADEPQHRDYAERTDHERTIQMRRGSF